MAASGFTPIQLYRTTTASAVPVNTNLADGELAINTTDERLYFKNAAGTVKLLASNAGALGDVTTTGTQTLTNKNIQSRVVVVSDATSITINGDTTDIATQANTQSAGTLTINAPTGTPFNGQKVILRLLSTNVQTFSWNAAFAGSTDVPLPTTSTGTSKYDYMGFVYNSTAAKWQIIAKNFGF
jgi:hypothetical protein